MARASGHAPSTIHRIWRAFGLQPHRSETFKLSSDPFFVEKVRDIVGLYLAPPDRALVLCVDEKSQIQALDRSQPLADAPRAGGAAQPRLQAPRHDLSLRGPRHRHGRDHRQMFPAPSGPRVPQIPRPRRGETSLVISTSTSSWTTTGPTRPRRSATGSPQRPRWQAHFTPTSASWLNQVERWFGLLTDKQIRRGVHRSTKELERTILDYIDTTNQNPKPFKWTKSADDILAAIQRFCLRTIETAEQQARKSCEASGSGRLGSLGGVARAMPAER